MLKNIFIFNFFLLLIGSSFIPFKNENTSITSITSNISSITPKVFVDEEKLGVLEISKLHLKEDIYPFNSDKNNVDEHVSILNGSIFPDQKSSILFIAAHSGSGKIAYFKDLDKLEYGDVISFYYKGYQYIYKVINSFEQEKDGDIEISKTSNHQLILTTCSPSHSDKQLIIDTMLIQKKNLEA